MQNFINNLKNDKKMLFLFIAFIAIVAALIVIQFTGGSSEPSESADAASSGDASSDAEAYSSASGVTPTEETLSSTVFTPCFQIGDTTLYIGEATVQDLVDAGAAFNEESEASVIEFSEDPLEERSLTFTVGDSTLYVTVQNPVDEIAQLKDSVVTDAYWNGTSIAGIAGVMYGDTLEELLEKAGDPYTVINSEDYDYEIASLPSTSRVYTYCDVIDHAVLLVTVDRNTYQVNHIEEQSAGSCITNASEVTEEQMQELVDGYFAEKTLPESVSYTSEDGITTSGTISDLTFTQVQCAAIKDFETQEEAEEFYDVKSNGYLRSSYLLVEYTATVTFSDESSKTGVGGFVVYDPGVDAAGSIVSLSGTAFSSDISSLYASSDLFIEKVLTPSAYYEIAFGSGDYDISTNAY